MLSSNGTTLVAFAGSLFIARLLSPAEIGLYSIAVAFVGLAQILRDFGASSYIVQCEEPDRETLRSALGSMVLFSWTLAALLWTLSGAIASFYAQAQLQPLLRILAINLLLTPLGAVTLALLRREMHFGTVGLVDFASTLTQISITCLIAWRGGGASSLAWGSLAGVVATVLMTLPHRKPGQPWLPGVSRLRDVVGFGAYASSASLLGHLNISASDLLLGKLLGAEAVGLFGRAIGSARLLTTVLMRGVSPVVAPLFARLRRAEGDIEAGFLAAASRLTVVAWPTLAFMAVLAEEIIVLLYGQQWIHTVPLVPIVCIATAIGIPFVVVSQMLVGLGRPELTLRIEALNLPIKIALIIAAAPWGLRAVAVAMVLSACAGAAYQLWTLRRHFGVRLRGLLRTFATSAGITLIPALVIWLMRQQLHSKFPDILMIAITGLVGAGAWFGAVFLFRHPITGDLAFLLPFLRKDAPPQARL